MIFIGQMPLGFLIPTDLSGMFLVTGTGGCPFVIRTNHDGRAAIGLNGLKCSFLHQNVFFLLFSTFFAKKYFRLF